MKFMCLVCLDNEAAASISKADWRAIDADSLAYDDELIEQRHYVTSSALAALETARTIRVRQGSAMVTDGPYAETKEHVAGFIIVEAADMNEAMRLAAKIPLARIGSVEVRALVDIKPN